MTLIQRLTSTPDGQRVFEQERAIFEVTELISRLMEEQGVSKADLARKLKTSKPNVTQMLDGRRNMTLRSIADVMFHLGMSLVVSSRSITSDEEWHDVTFRVWHQKPELNSWNTRQARGPEAKALGLPDRTKMAG